MGNSVAGVRRSLRDSFGGWWGAGQGHGLGVGQSSWVYTGHREESRQLRLWVLGAAAARAETPESSSVGPRRQSLQEPLASSRSNTHFPGCYLFPAPYGSLHTSPTPPPPRHCLLSSRTPREPCYGLWPGGLQFIGNRDLCCGLACCFP